MNGSAATGAAAVLDLTRSPRGSADTAGLTSPLLSDLGGLLSALAVSVLGRFRCRKLAGCAGLGWFLPYNGALGSQSLFFLASASS